MGGGGGSEGGGGLDGQRHRMDLSALLAAQAVGVIGTKSLVAPDKSLKGLGKREFGHGRNSINDGALPRRTCIRYISCGARQHP